MLVKFHKMKNIRGNFLAYPGDIQVTLVSSQAKSVKRGPTVFKIFYVFN